MANEYRIRGCGEAGVEFFTSRLDAEQYARIVVRESASTGNPNPHLTVEMAPRIGRRSDPSSYLGDWRAVAIVYSRRTVRP